MHGRHHADTAWGRLVLVEVQGGMASPAAGQFYGEIALLDDRPRTATVVAKTDVTVDIIGRREFADMLEMHPQIAERLTRRGRPPGR